MPIIYRAQCKSCRSAPDPNGSGDSVSRPEGSSFSEGYLAVRLNNNELAVLPHPSENITLKKYGFTHEQASKEKRLYYFQYKICEECGTLHKEQQVPGDPKGCLPSIIAGVATMILVWFFAKANWFISCCAGLLMFLFVGILFSKIYNRQRRNEIETLKLKSCTHCRGNRFKAIHEIAKKPVMCPFCKTRNMTYIPVAIS
jgi:hypothetical protein